MLIDNETKTIFDSLRLLDKLFDVARLVDPKEKRVLRLEKGSIIFEDNKCFYFWERNVMCDNCISIRALNENKIFVKMEYSPNIICMVTAVPVEINNHRIVIELIKNITENFSLENPTLEVDSEIYQLIDNLQKITLRDTLTGVYNRRYINERLPADIINAVLAGQRLSIIMVDIDFFKKINDTYGHITGDIVLRDFAQTLLRNLEKQEDWIARYGGEEFLVCLPGSGLGEAEIIAEKLRRSIEDNAINQDEITIKITASFGVSTIDNVQEKDISRFIEQADKKLYAAKENGRNRVEA